jgi:uncharacterized protein (DUF1330 family)
MAKRPGYIVAQTEVTDPNIFQEYLAKVRPSLTAYNARLLARSEGHAKEGPVPKGMVFIVEFNSLADAEHWYGSRPAAELLRSGFYVEPSRRTRRFPNNRVHAGQPAGPRHLTLLRHFLPNPAKRGRSTMA